MGYCVLADVQAEFKNITFSAGLNVTDTTVTQFIAEGSALIDTYVGGRYATPITGPNSLLVMSLYCRTLVADRIRGILETKQVTNTDSNQNAKNPGLSTSDVIKALIQIQNGNTVLSDATLQNLNASFFSNNSQNGVQPRFRKNRRQW